MSTPAVAAMAEDEDIAVARAVLAADRGLTNDEQGRFRNALWRMQERGDRIALATLHAIIVEIGRRADSLARDQLAEMNAKAAQERAAHLRARPDRWKALPLMSKAMYHAAADRETGQSERRILLALAAIIADPGLEDSAPPPTFEAPDFGGRR